MQKIQVCAVWNGTAGEHFEWENNVTTAPTYCVIDTDDSGRGWPFVAAAPLHVPGHANGVPGKLRCQIAPNLPDGTYAYESECCSDGVPKSVTIP